MQNILKRVKKLISVKRNKSILLAGSSSLLIRFFTIGISFFTIPMTLNYLGNERYGTLLMLTTSLSLMTFADLGLGNNLVNEISKGYAENNVISLKKSISSTFYLILGISFILVAVLLIIMPFLKTLIIAKINTNIQGYEVFDTFLVIIFSILISMPLGIVQKIFDGFQISYIYQIISFFSTITSIFVLLFFIELKLGLPYLAFAFSSASLLSNIIGGGYLFFYKKPHLIPKFKYFNFSQGLVSIKIGLIFVVLQLFSFMNLSIDSFIIQSFLGVANVTTFELVRKLFSVSFIFIFFISPMWPAFSEALHNGDILWAKRTFYNSLKLLIGAGAFFLLPLVIFGKQIFNFWIGPGYIPSLIILIGFYFYSLIGLFGGIVASLFNSDVFLKRQLIVVSLSSITTLITKIILTKFLGVDYVIWANVICFSIFFIFPSMIEINRFFKLKEKVL